MKLCAGKNRKRPKWPFGLEEKINKTEMVIRSGQKKNYTISSTKKFKKGLDQIANSVWKKKWGDRIGNSVFMVFGKKKSNHAGLVNFHLLIMVYEKNSKINASPSLANYFREEYTSYISIPSKLNCAQTWS